MITGIRPLGWAKHRPYLADAGFIYRANYIQWQFLLKDIGRRPASTLHRTTNPSAIPAASDHRSATASTRAAGGP